MTNVAKEKREMIFVGVTASIVRETEKAYQVEVQYWTKADQPVKKAKMWVPKSCSKVEDGKVTQIADFILDQWVKEHNEYIKSYTRLIPTIYFDIPRHDAILAKKKEEQKEYNALVKTIGEFVKPWAAEEIAADAAVWVVWGEYVAKRFGVEKGIELAEFGRKIQKTFGVNEGMMNHCNEGIEKNHHDYKHSLIVIDYYTIQTSILGSFRADREFLETHNAPFNESEWRAVVGCYGIQDSSIRNALKKYIEIRKEAREIFFAFPSVEEVEKKGV